MHLGGFGRRQIPRFWRWMIPPVATLACGLVQLACSPEPGIAPFVFFYLAVVASAWVGGRGPGLLSVGLSALAADYVFIGERWAWTLTPGALVAEALYLVGASATALVCASFRGTELRMRAFYDSGVVGAFYWSSDGTITDANDRFLDMLGYTREDLDEGRVDWVAMTPAEYRAIDEAALAQYHATARGPSYEKEFVRKDGSRLPVMVGGATIDPEHREGVAFALDITDRKRSEAAMQDRMELMKLSQDAIVVWRFGDGIETWNRGAEMLYGYTADEALGEHTHELLQTTLPKSPEAFDDELRRNGSFEGEIGHVTKDGRRLAVWSRMQVVRGADGQMRVLEANRDITDRKRAEEALLEADRRKDDFLAMLSHELRNPLAPIRNSLVLLDRAPPGSPQERRAKAIIERQVQQMTRLVSDLLDVSRIARGKIQLQPERMDLRETVQRVLEDHRTVFAARKIALRADLPSGSLWIDGDPARVGQAVGNLLHNAAKFTQEGGEVCVLLSRTDHRTVLRVRDTGVGIAPEMLPKLFQPFTQAGQTLDRSAGGLGLGLALVKGLIEMQGGAVSVTSPGVGRGAEFVLELPLVDAPAEEEPVESTHEPLHTRRVLVVEDNVDAAESLKYLLESDAHEVEIAFSGPEALEKAHRFVPDVVLCDIGLPGMNGYEVARAFRADDTLRDTSLIALTGYALPEDRRRATEAGFDRHLPKPPDFALLERMLSELPSV